MKKNTALSLLGILCISIISMFIGTRIGYENGFEYGKNLVIPETVVECVDYDSNMAFEKFLTTVTDNQGFSRFDFDIELPFDKTESGDVIVKVHINKGDVLEEK